jgi:hypothetical protein
MKTAVEFYREELNALVSLRETKFKTEQEIFEQAKDIELKNLLSAQSEAYLRGYNDGQKYNN